MVCTEWKISHGWNSPKNLSIKEQIKESAS